MLRELFWGDREIRFFFEPLRWLSSFDFDVEKAQRAKKVAVVWRTTRSTKSDVAGSFEFVLVVLVASAASSLWLKCKWRHKNNFNNGEREWRAPSVFSGEAEAEAGEKQKEILALPMFEAESRALTEKHADDAHERFPRCKRLCLATLLMSELRKVRSARRNRKLTFLDSSSCSSSSDIRLVSPLI